MKGLTIKTLKVYLYDKNSYRKKLILIGDAILMGNNIGIEMFPNNDIRLTFKITKKKKGYEILSKRPNVLFSRNCTITLKMTAVDDSGKEKRFTGRGKNCVIIDYYQNLDGEYIKAILQPLPNGESALELFEK